MTNTTAAVETMKSVAVQAYRSPPPPIYVVFDDADNLWRNNVGFSGVGSCVLNFEMYTKGKQKSQMHAHRPTLILSHIYRPKW